MKNRVRAVLFGVLAFGTAEAAISPNDFDRGSDSDRIEAAIGRAVRGGERTVEIPRLNAKRDQPVWLIERAILVPSDFTLVLRGCRIQLAPGTQDNLIRNAGTARTPMQGDRNIRILGMGNAVLSGGTEAHFDPPGDKSGWRTIGVLLCGVRHFTLDGFGMEETQAWAISVENGCAYGRISNIAFNSSNKMPNQDGVDVRKGCHDILIENITGSVGDDAVALTGLRSDKPPAPGRKAMQLGGRAPTDHDDIYNITIRNVQAKCVGGHGIIRLLNHDGIRLYNIIVRDVIDTSTDRDPRVQAAVRIGDTNYSSMRKAEPGEMFNIVVDTVLTRGHTGVTILGPLKNARIDNILGFGGCTNLIRKSAVTQNVTQDRREL
ncbi:MAG: glycosyl hydrolase family 28 protein [Kiritimatiellia bacterium]|nr:glycosyl hydrolase family 28 protein [Kiritimatiellia bacterium]